MRDDTESAVRHVLRDANVNTTTARFPRSIWDAFPADRPAVIEHYERPRAKFIRDVLPIAASVIAAALLIGLALTARNGA